MRTVFKAFCAAVAIGCIAAPAASAATPFGGKLTVNLGVAGVLPDESAKISPIGGTVDISNTYVPATTLDYALSDKLSVELLCCVTPHKVKAVSTAVGTVNLGKVTLFRKRRFQATYAHGSRSSMRFAGQPATIFSRTSVM